MISIYMANFFPKTVKEISEILGCELIGNSEKVINNINRLGFSNEDELTFYSDKKYESKFLESKSSVIISNKLFSQLTEEQKVNRTFIITENAYSTTIILANIIDESSKKYFKSNKYESILLPEIDDTAEIANQTTIEFNTKFGANVLIYPNCYIGYDVEIGENTTIYPNVTIMHGTKIGKNCIIHSGAVIGSDGFGYYEEGKEYRKIPQIGNVEIGDNVEIGANTTIDRAFIGSTILKNGVKIDNLVQIGHNCVIGENTAIVSQVGIAGSTTIGKNVKLGGQVGVSGHIEICDDVTIYAQSGVGKSVKQAGTYFGSPIKDVKEAFRVEILTNKLPEIYKNLNELNNKVNKLFNDKINESN